jgi:Kef-type K+ transport system membrane component KefB
VFAILLCLLPWIAMIWLIIHFAKKNQRRTALGIGVGIASIIGVTLLLVAACFGLLSNTNFH